MPGVRAGCGSGLASSGAIAVQSIVILGMAGSEEVLDLLHD